MQTKGSWGIGKVTFLAHKDAIQGLLEKGYSKKMVYQLYADHLRISYAQFCQYTRRYLEAISRKPKRVEP